MKRSLHAAARLALATFAVLLVVLAARPARAHEVGLSRGEYAARGASVTAQITFARRDVITLVAGLDADHDGTLTAAELERDRDAIAGAIVGRLHVRGDGAACPGELAEARLAEEDGVSFQAIYRCPAPPRAVDIEVALLEDLPFGHRHLAHFAGASGPSDAVLYLRNRSFSFEPTPGQASTEAPRASYKGKLSFFPMGIEHILTGYDTSSSCSAW